MDNSIVWLSTAARDRTCTSIIKGDNIIKDCKGERGRARGIGGGRGDGLQKPFGERDGDLLCRLRLLDLRGCDRETGGWD